MQIELLEKYKFLQQELYKGDVIATSSGQSINLKYALHAAMIDYNDGIKGIDKLPTLDSIDTILQNIEPYLKWYVDNHNNEPSKLVLPLMGYRVGGL